MPEVTQICVGLENRPGMFAKLCSELRNADARIVALFVSDEAGCCWVNLVAEPSSVAEQTLRDAGYNLFTESVLTLQVRSGSDGLEQVARMLADNGVNISYVYGSTGGSDEYTLVLKVDDQQRAAEILQAVHVN